MLVASCPRCGANVALSLDRIDVLRCRHCEHVGPFDPATARALAVAIAALESQEPSRRQLSRVQQRAMSMSQPVLVVILLLVLALLYGAVSLVVVAVVVSLARMEREVGDYAYVLGLGLAAAAVVASVIFIWRLQRVLQAACAAVPPQAPGEPATCRVCGGPLQVEGGEAVVRCDYCRADNLVSGSVLRRAAAHTMAATRDLATHVEAQARAVRSRRGWPLVVMGALMLFGPLGSLGITWLLVRRAKAMPARYVIYQTDAGRCILRVHHHAFAGEYFGLEGERIFRRFVPADDRERMTPKSLIGRKVLTPMGTVGVVRQTEEAVYPHPGLILELESDGLDYSIGATRTCLVDQPVPRKLLKVEGDDALHERPPELAVDGKYVLMTLVGASHSTVYVMDRAGAGWVALELDRGWLRSPVPAGGDVIFSSAGGIEMIPSYASHLGKGNRRVEITPRKLTDNLDDFNPRAGVAADQRHVYFARGAAERHGVWRITRGGGGAPERVAESDGAIDDLVSTPRYVYWISSQRWNRTLFRVPKSGGPPEKVSQATYHLPPDLLSDGERVFCIRSGLLRLGKEPKQVVPSATVAAVGGGKVAWYPDVAYESESGLERLPGRRLLSENGPSLWQPGVKVRAQAGGKVRNLAPGSDGRVVRKRKNERSRYEPIVAAIATDAEGTCWAARSPATIDPMLLVVCRE